MSGGGGLLPRANVLHPPVGVVVGTKLRLGDVATVP